MSGTSASSPHIHEPVPCQDTTTDPRYQYAATKLSIGGIDHQRPNKPRTAYAAISLHVLPSQHYSFCPPVAVVGDAAAMLAGSILLYPSVKLTVELVLLATSTPDFCELWRTVCKVAA